MNLYTKIIVWLPTILYFNFLKENPKYLLSLERNRILGFYMPDNHTITEIV